MTTNTEPNFCVYDTEGEPTDTEFNLSQLHNSATMREAQTENGEKVYIPNPHGLVNITRNLIKLLYAKGLVEMADLVNLYGIEFPSGGKLGLRNEAYKLEVVEEAHEEEAEETSEAEKMVEKAAEALIEPQPEAEYRTMIAHWSGNRTFVKVPKNTNDMMRAAKFDVSVNEEGRFTVTSVDGGYGDGATFDDALLEAYVTREIILAQKDKDEGQQYTYGDLEIVEVVEDGED